MAGRALAESAFDENGRGHFRGGKGKVAVAGGAEAGGKEFILTSDDDRQRDVRPVLLCERAGAQGDFQIHTVCGRNDHDGARGPHRRAAGFPAARRRLR